MLGMNKAKHILAEKSAPKCDLQNTDRFYTPQCVKLSYAALDVISGPM